MDQRTESRSPLQTSPVAAGAHDLTRRSRPSRAIGQCARALLVSLLFAALLLANLLYPVPKGPYDNGDFKRIFATFSSGPRDLPFWPPDTTSTDFYRRFSFYHRYWRLDDGVPGAALPSTSNLLFLPARVVRAGQPATFFDLTANSIYLSALLAAGLFLSLLSLRDPVPFAALSLFALLMSDANLSGYVNSFYQESGAFVYLFLYVCALHVFWQRRTRTTFVLAAGLCVLLAGTKFAYVLTACAVIAPALAGVAGARWPSVQKRRLVALGAAAILASMASSLWVLSDQTVSKAAAYIFVFGTALPALPPGDRPSYLSSLDLDPALVSEVGKGAFDRDSRCFSDPRLNERLGTPLLARAIVRLLRDHPRAMLHLLHEAGSHAGTYPALMYESDPARKPGPTWAIWSGWSAIHEAFLHGWLLYAIALVSCAVLGASLVQQPTDGWRLFFWVVALSFLCGSILQALISVFGNGLVDAERHDFLATMLMDGVLISVVAGLWLARSESAAATSWGARAAAGVSCRHD